MISIILAAVPRFPSLVAATDTVSYCKVAPKVFITITIVLAIVLSIVLVLFLALVNMNDFIFLLRLPQWFTF